MPRISGGRALVVRATLVGSVSSMVVWCMALVPLEVRAQPAAATAEATAEVAEDAEAPPPAPAPAPAPYSVPFYLRPLPAVNVVRLDAVLAPHDRVASAASPDASGLTLDTVQLVTVGVRVADWLGLIARMGWDYTADPGEWGLSNLVLGGNFAARLDAGFRVSAFVAVSLPVGTDSNGQTVHRNARFARLAMDNAMFVVDHMAGIVGVGGAWVGEGWTVQAEATLLAFGRVEGTGDEAIVNSTFGLLVGYFLLPEFSITGELHHQHFLSDPVAVIATPELRSQTSGTLGVRFHIQAMPGVWIRPGLSWSAGFDPPLSTDAWQMLQVDVPVLF